MTFSQGIGVAKAQPAPPATFAGSVKLDGQSVPDGTPVLALVNGKICGEGSREPGQKGTWTLNSDMADLPMYEGDSIYIVDVVSDSQTPGCGTEGTTVTFQVGGQPAQEQGLWKAGFNSLNLTVEEAPTSATAPQQQAPSAVQGPSDDSFPRWGAIAGGASAAAIVAGLLAVAWWRMALARRRA